MPFERLSSEESMREELYRLATVLGLHDVLGTGRDACLLFLSLAKFYLALHPT